MSVRLSLLKSSRQKEERLQIGRLTSPFLDDLIELEKQCLLELSKAARNAGQTQIALNSALRARNLERSPSFEVSEEYANVLWSFREEKVAVKFLGKLVRESKFNSLPPVTRATLYSKLMRHAL